MSDELLSKADALRMLVDLAKAGKHKPTHVGPDEIMFRVKCPTGRTQTATARLAGRHGAPSHFVFESLSVPESKDGEERALVMNGQINFSIVAIQPHEGTDHLVLRHVRPIADCDPEEVQVAIEDVAVLADRLAAEVGAG